MSNAVSTVVNQAPLSLPAALKDLFGDVQATFSDLAGGVVSGFPTISYRGKVWRIRKGGEEENYLDANGDAVQSLEVVLVKSNPQPAKIFYDKPFEEGSIEAPRCWSANGMTPDIAVQNPISAQCQSCPNNQWGSKINKDTGSKGRACSDARRIAVVSLHELEAKGIDATKCLLRIPPASLNPLKDYAEKTLKPKGIPYFAVVTRIGFDTQTAYPKLTFRATRFLTEDEARAVMDIQQSEEVKRILAESTEFAGAAAATADEGPKIAGVMPAAMQAPAAPAVVVPASQPAPATVTAPPQPVTTAAPPPQTSAVAQEVLPPRKPRGRPPKAQPITVASNEASASPPPTQAENTAPAGDDFDSMLDQLLG